MSAFPRALQAPSITSSFTPEVLNDVVGTWACAAAETFLYGAYLIMFVFYVQVLHKRGLGRNRFLAKATIALFVLCTTHCVLVLAAVAKRSTLDLAVLLLVEGDPVPKGQPLMPILRGLSLAANVVYVTANVLADTIFILRCYAIWNRQFKIILFPIFLTFGVAGIGYFNAFYAVMNSSKSVIEFGTFGTSAFFFLPALFDASIAVSLFTTFILMGLTVGRIWVFSRSARHVFGAKVTSRYHAVCAMILESGALYLCGGIIFIVLGFVGSFNTDIKADGIVLAQLVGIAPTIIAVRVALGQSVESVNSFIMPGSRVHSSFDSEAGVVTPVNSVDGEMLYIRPKSIKVEPV
ncbi:hypothetical protein B0H13DRAFT_2282560 [Mycena leptocephala]|nr:hypothetical protein B0H13DRAFT_2282560 [Mycena leptocephala]